MRPPVLFARAACMRAKLSARFDPNQRRDHDGKWSDGLLGDLDVMDSGDYWDTYGDQIDEQTVEGVHGHNLTVRVFESGDAHLVLETDNGKHQPLSEMNPGSMREMAAGLRELLDSDLAEGDANEDGFVFEIKGENEPWLASVHENGDLRLHVDADDPDAYLDLSENDAANLADALEAMADGYDERFGEDDGVIAFWPGGILAHLPGKHDQSEHGRKKRKLDLPDTPSAPDGGGEKKAKPARKAVPKKAAPVTEAPGATPEPVKPKRTPSKRVPKTPSKAAPAVETPAEPAKKTPARKAPAKKPVTPAGPSEKQGSKTYTGPRFTLPRGVSAADYDEAYGLMVKRRLRDISHAEAMRLSELQFHVLPQAVVARLDQDVSIDAEFEAFRLRVAPDTDPVELRKRMQADVERAVSGKPIGVRVTEPGLKRLLTDGRFKTQFETGRSLGLLDPEYRASVEAAAFGLPENSSKAKRPVYGYVLTGGVRAAGEAPTTDRPHEGDALSQYGKVQVILHDRVRDRTTAMVGDSLSQVTQGRPSPVNDPDWRSFTFPAGGPGNRGMTTLDRDLDGDEFRAHKYVEAQIHDGVTVDDIAEVVFPSKPSADLIAALEQAGVEWRVLS